MSNTKKNKTCINFPDLINPFDLLNAVSYSIAIEGVADIIGNVIEGIST